MPSTSPATMAARAQMVAETGPKALTQENAQQHEKCHSNAPQEQGSRARRRRYRERQRAKKQEERSAADDGFPTTMESETEAQKSNDVRAPSPPSDTDTVATLPLPRAQLERTSQHHPTTTLNQVPVLPHYELRDLASANRRDNDSDQGLFATQAIKQGTRIISEPPILTLPAPGDQLDELMSAYHRLSKPDQARIWTIRPANPEASEQLQNLRFLTDRLAYDLQNLLLKPPATRIPQEQAVLDSMTPKLQNAMTVWRLAARWHLNRCSLINLPTSLRSNLPIDTPITGLFIQRAHIRHSCVPNCFASFDAARGCLNVQVVRDVDEGEELTLAAFADSNFYHDKADRAREMDAWGLVCECEACDEENPRFAVHEAARQRAHARVVIVNDILTRLERDELSVPTLTTLHTTLLSLLRDLTLTSRGSTCASIERVRWLTVLVDRVLPARAQSVPDGEKIAFWKEVLGYARECKRAGMVCFGGDREEVGVLRGVREGVEGVLGGLEGEGQGEEE